MAKKYFILVVLAFIAAISTAQKNNLKFNVVELPTEVLNKSVNCFLETDEGFLWMGSAEGLIFYDGYKAKRVALVSEEGVPMRGIYVKALQKGADESIWIGTPLGVYNYNYKSETIDVSKYDKLSQIICRSLYTTKQGELVIASENGVYIYNPMTDHLQHFAHVSGLTHGLSHNIVRCVYEDAEGVLWLGTYDKLNRLDRKTNRIDSYKIQSEKAGLFHQNNLILCIAALSKDEPNKLLIGTETGLAIFDTATTEYELFTKGATEKGLSNSVVKSIQVVAPEKIWLGTDNGLNIFNSKTKTFEKYYADFKNNTSISENVISVIYRDSKDHVWLGTQHQVDVTLLANDQFLNGKLSENFDHIKEGVQVNAVTQDAAKNYWFATNEGFAKYDVLQGTYEWFEVPNSTNKEVKDVVVDHRGIVWLTTSSGLYLYFPDKRQYKRYVANTNQKNALRTNYVSSLHEDSQGNIWIGSYKKGFYRAVLADDGEVSFFEISPSVSGSDTSNELFVLGIQSTNNCIWLATSTGLKKIDTNSGTFIEIPELKESRGAFCVEKGIALWVVASDELYRYDLANNTIQMVSKIPKGVRTIKIQGDQLWFCTYKKMYNIQKDGSNLREISSVYTGVQNYGRTSYLSSDGRLIFGALYGFVSFRPEDVVLDSSNSTVHFTGLKVLNKEITSQTKINDKFLLKQSIDATDYLEFDYSENTFSFEFSVLNHGVREENKYRYMLDGYEKDWQELTEGEHTASYSLVKPGSYVFKVKAANNLGEYSDAYRSIAVKVNPPFFASVPAIILYVLVFFILLLIYRRILARRIQDRNVVELERLERYKSEELVAIKTRFFTNITHELKTPLTLISSPVEDLLTMPLDAEVVKSLTLVKRNTDRLRKLVAQILDIRKLESGGEKLNIQESDFTAFCIQVIDKFEEEASRREITLKLDTPNDGLYIWFDVEKVEKILFNLLSNAFKFTPNGGVIGVQVYTGTVEKGDDASFLYVAVSDTGSGIDEKDQLQIFDRFNSLSSSSYIDQKGTGIGLSLIHDYVTLHGGSIEYENTENSGSKFTFCLPKDKAMLLDYEEVVIPENLDQEELEQQFEEEESSFSSQSGLLKALIVEDDEDMRSFLVNGLKSSYAILEASDGKEGISVARKELPDIIVSDLMMPKVDGIEFCEKIKSDVRTSHIPFVLLTAKSGIEDKISGLETGADDYLQKPFNLAFLRIRMKNLIAQREELKKIFQQELIIQPSEITVNSVDEKFLKELLEKIEAEIENPNLNVKLLSELLGMNSTNMYRKIKAITGKTATEFIRNTRLKRAEQLLKTGQFNVSEVMYMVGFTHSSYFSKCFKELFGVTPKKYVK